MKYTRDKKSLWRQFLEDEEICLYSEGKCPCDRGINCNKCLENETYEKFLIYKKEKNINKIA